MKSQAIAAAIAQNAAIRAACAAVRASLIKDMGWGDEVSQPISAEEKKGKNDGKKVHQD